MSANWKAGESAKESFEVVPGTLSPWSVKCVEDGTVVFTTADKAKAEQYAAVLAAK